jgi:hypothetical protein
MKLIKNILYVIIATTLLSSCSVNKNRVTWDVYLNRTIQREKVKPFDKVLIIADLYEIPHADHLFKRSYSILKSNLEEEFIPTQLIIKDYKKDNPDEEIEHKIAEYQPSHIIYTSHPMIDFNEYVKYDYVDVKIVDRVLNEQVWKGRIVTPSMAMSLCFQRGIFRAVVKDNFIKSKPQALNKK